MATHIVRIYRSAKGPPAWMVGVVEEVGGEEQRGFQNAEELWAVLAELEGVSARSGKRAKGPAGARRR